MVLVRSKSRTRLHRTTETVSHGTVTRAGRYPDCLFVHRIFGFIHNDTLNRQRVNTANGSRCNLVAFTWDTHDKFPRELETKGTAVAFVPCAVARTCALSLLSCN